MKVNIIIKIFFSYCRVLIYNTLNEREGLNEKREFQDDSDTWDGYDNGQKKPPPVTISKSSIINSVQHQNHVLLSRKPVLLIITPEQYSSHLLAGGLAWLTQLRFTYEPSLMSPGGLTSTRVFFGESKQANRQRETAASILLCSCFYVMFSFS